MNLRRQLVLVALLLLSLPWAGCQFIREMEGAMRHGQEQSLQATAKAVAAVLGQNRELLYPNTDRLTAAPDQRPSLYALPATQSINVDGYADGWEGVAAIEFHDDDNSMELSVSARAVTRNNTLYLLLQIRDPELIYHNPGLSREPNGDRLILRTWQENRRQDYVIATAAPGSVRATAASRRQRGADAGRIRGYWQDARGGYTLELELPLSYTGGRLGFYVINASSREDSLFESLGNTSPLQNTAPPWLIYSPGALQQALAPFANQGTQIQVVDQQAWLIGNLVGTAAQQDNSDTFWLLQVLYRSILSDDSLGPAPAPPALGRLQGDEINTALAGSHANVRYRDANYATRTELAASSPVYYEDEVIGAVIVRQSGEEYLSLTDQAFSRLLGYSMLALGIGAFGLLGFASLLSWRIRRLSLAAAQVVSEDGSIGDKFPRSRAKDEIGELSRHYGDLLDQVREYNDYLRTLSRKLSHELRTPIAVIQTSLENLEQTTTGEQEASIYLDRAKEGLNRLNRILTAMSEANRLEESIRNNHKSTVDLVPLLTEIHAAYVSLYPNHKIGLDIEPPKATANASPELLVQALDKLMENAASFCPAGERIDISLAGGADGWIIGVSNRGATLPGNLRDRLFDPMVSLRQGDANAVHLGLGLHIVKLISDFHHGTVKASNLPGDEGVRISITLPATDH